MSCPCCQVENVNDAISFPVDRWWVRLGHRAVDVLLKLFNSSYHPYVHSMAAVVDVAANAGLQPVEISRRHIWQIAMFERTSIFPTT